MEPIYICVDDYEINNGKPMDCDNCPLALAIGRVLGRDDVLVSLDCVWVGDLFFAYLPKIAQDFRARFDAELPVQTPFEFYILPKFPVSLLKSLPHSKI